MMADDAAQDLLPQGVAMRDAVAADLLSSGDCDLTVATFDGVDAVAGAVAASAHRGEDAPAFVARLAKRHDAVWAIAPETGGCLASLARAVGPLRWIGCDAGTIVLAASKAATVERLHAQGLPTPLTEPLAHASRWVVKPDDGAGTVHTHVHPTQARALAHAAQRRGAHVEPWIEGDALSLSLLCRARGDAELLSVNRQRIAVSAAGDVHYAGVDIAAIARSDARHAALASLACDVAAALPGLRGYVGVDLVWHPQRGPVVIEVNPRVTCAYVGLSRRLSRNLAAEVLAEFADA